MMSKGGSLGQTFIFHPHTHAEFMYSNTYTVKPVYSDRSKIDKTKVLTTNGSLRKVESIAECSLGAFCNTSDLH